MVTCSVAGICRVYLGGGRDGRLWKGARGRIVGPLSSKALCALPAVLGSQSKIEQGSDTFFFSWKERTMSFLK